MMKTKLTVIMLLIAFVLLFSGCGCKPIYLPCKAERPIRTEVKVCGGIQDKREFAECVRTKYITLDSDYAILQTRFDSCK